MPYCKNNPPYNIFDDDISKEEKQMLMKEEVQFNTDEFNKMLIKNGRIPPTARTWNLESKKRKINLQKEEDRNK